jgi:hypothetical protein
LSPLAFPLSTKYLEPQFLLKLKGDDLIFSKIYVQN